MLVELDEQLREQGWDTDSSVKQALNGQPSSRVQSLKMCEEGDPSGYGVMRYL